MAASASCTAMPSAANNFAVSLLPMAIEPVRPMTKGLSCMESAFQHGAQARRDRRLYAKERLKGGLRLVHQHTQPINHEMAALGGVFQQLGFQRIIDDIADRGRCRQR